MDAKQIKKIYSNLAKEYNSIIKNKAKYIAYKKISKLTIKHLNKKNARILDLGCGTGLSSIEFLKKGYKVTGVDIAKGMISEAKKLPFEKFVCQNIETPLNVSDDSFDAVTLVGVMEFIENPTQLFKEVNKKLIQEGVFALTLPKKMSKNSQLNIKSYYKKEIEKIIKTTNFKIIETHKFFGYRKNNENVEYYGYILKKNEIQNKKICFTNKNFL